MADIFVSYASEDRDRVQPLVAALETEGWTVWWDRELHAGSRFDSAIEEAIDAAACIVVVWSSHSIQSDWVRTEANEGLDRAILAPALFDDVRLPLAFRRTQTAQMIGWPTERGGLSTLIGGIQELIGGSGAPPAPQQAAMPRSLVVLPFANMSSDPEQESFVDGITEDLIDRLANVADLKVIARTSSFQFKGKTDDVREIGQKLGVTHLVEGSVRRAGNRVRITAQLVRADDGTHEWSKHYDRDLDDVFALQDEITLEIGKQLTKVLKPAQSSYQPKAEAYEELLRGRSWLRRLSHSAAVRAVRHFENAIDHDPGFALAHAEAARASLTERAFSTEHSRQTLERAAKFNDAALAIDADLLLCRVTRAGLQLSLEYRLQDAITAMQALQSEAPGSPEVLEALCTVYWWSARSDALETAALELKRLDPLSVRCHFSLLSVYSAAHRWDEFDRAVQSIFAIEPEHRVVWSGWAMSKLERDRVDEAYEMIVAKKMQDWPQACFVYARQGDRDRIMETIAKIEPQPGLRVWLTHCYALIEDLEGVVRMIRAAIENHDPQLWHIVGWNMWFQWYLGINGKPLGDIYSSDAVQAVLREVGLDSQSIDALRI